jgi:histidyl-tRNA synthetase
LGLTSYELRINSRQLLAALAELCGGPEKMTDITIAIDKLDKVGLEKVKEELKQRGLNNDEIGIINMYLLMDGTNEMKLNQVKKLFAKSKTGNTGIKEIEFILNSGLITDKSRLTIDFTLARGLNYYTGIIFEAKAPPEIKIGSIGGGGRYDDLTGLFGVPDIPGVGISFGVDRIYDVLEELNLFPVEVYAGTQVLFFNLGDTESKTAYKLMRQLREQNVRCEIYHESVKFDKQFKYAEKKKIPFVVIIGSKEVEEKTCMLKDLRTGNQQSITFKQLLATDFN